MRQAPEVRIAQLLAAITLPAVAFSAEVDGRHAIAIVVMAMAVNPFSVLGALVAAGFASCEVQFRVAILKCLRFSTIFAVITSTLFYFFTADAFQLPSPWFRVLLVGGMLCGPPGLAVILTSIGWRIARKVRAANE